MPRSDIVGMGAGGWFGCWESAAWALAPTTAPPQPATPPAVAAPTSPTSSTASPAPANAASVVVGGKLHGVVKSGNVPLPGVTVTAQNTLTGKRFSTTTDVTGAWSMTIPQNGRYVIRTQL